MQPVLSGATSGHARVIAMVKKHCIDDVVYNSKKSRFCGVKFTVGIGTPKQK